MSDLVVVKYISRTQSFLRISARVQRGCLAKSSDVLLSIRPSAVVAMLAFDMNDDAAENVDAPPLHRLHVSAPRDHWELAFDTAEARDSFMREIDGGLLTSDKPGGIFGA